jgi:hypothetical protein
MLKLLVFVIAVIVSIYGYAEHQKNPTDIDNPVYLESRVSVQIHEIGRELEYVFVGETVSQEDCKERTKEYLSKLFSKCDTCNLKVQKCRSDLAKRYKNLFKGKTIHTTYLSLDRKSRFERNGRMVIWGLTDKEAEIACGIVKQKLTEKYEGEVQCIAGRLPSGNTD